MNSVYNFPLFYLWAEAIESFLVLFYYVFSKQPSDALAFCLRFAHFIVPWLKKVLVSMQLQIPAKHSLFCAPRVFLAWWVPPLLHRLCSLNWRKGKGHCQLSQKAYFLPRSIEIVLVCDFFYWKPDLCELAYLEWTMSHSCGRSKIPFWRQNGWSWFVWRCQSKCHLKSLACI